MHHFRGPTDLQSHLSFPLVMLLPQPQIVPVALLLRFLLPIFGCYLSRELVGPSEGLKLTTVASVKIPKPSNG
ncbi:hypothetical protein B296_00046424 [Ensete ventricosum]|uniref:Uncharacterized protein n=1 Tax=Ensete ventricosum TaxID=4639 RepID=A0A426XKP8_ENSVE|nr:hypothetical protein B296_00046424 [Ensete ventricosum]